ncbi:unnamed protein product, partial [Amoebophrya sp. A120]
EGALANEERRPGSRRKTTTRISYSCLLPNKQNRLHLLLFFIETASQSELDLFFYQVLEEGMMVEEERLVDHSPLYHFYLDLQNVSPRSMNQASDLMLSGWKHLAKKRAAQAYLDQVFRNEYNRDVLQHDKALAGKAFDLVIITDGTLVPWTYSWRKAIQILNFSGMQDSTPPSEKEAMAMDDFAFAKTGRGTTDAG